MRTIVFDSDLFRVDAVSYRLDTLLPVVVRIGENISNAQQLIFNFLSRRELKKEETSASTNTVDILRAKRVIIHLSQSMM